MSVFILPILFFVLLIFDRKTMSKKERIIYATLSALAIIFSIPASFALSLDYIGASLSGLVSVLGG